MLIDSLLSGQEGAFQSALSHLILPAIVLGTIPLAVIARQTRSAMLEVLGEDYVRTARAKGLSPARVIGLHALRNAMIPVITVIGLQVGVLFAGAILTETIFSWPGIGKWMVDSISRRDYSSVQGGLLLIAAIVMVVNLMVDLLYGLINPQITTHGVICHHVRSRHLQKHWIRDRPAGGLCSRNSGRISAKTAAPSSACFFSWCIVLIAVFADFIAPHLTQPAVSGGAFCNRPSGRMAAVPELSARHRCGRSGYAVPTDPRVPLFSFYRLYRCLGIALAGVILGLFAGFFRGRVDTYHHADHGCRTGLSQPAAGSGPRRHSGSEPDKRHDCHRHCSAAALCPLDPSCSHGRDDQGLCNGRPRYRGATELRLMFVTILPNCMAPLIVQAALSFSTAILDAAALGFLGMGAQPPTPEWGTMLAEAREFILTSLVGGDPARSRHPAHGSGHQPDGRRTAGCP